MQGEALSLNPLLATDMHLCQVLVLHNLCILLGKKHCLSGCLMIGSATLGLESLHLLSQSFKKNIQVQKCILLPLVAFSHI